jgi:hypothetical protein
MRYLPLLLPLLASVVAGAQRRNVVLYITDDQGKAAGCYGDPDARTPALDAALRRGLRHRPRGQVPRRAGGVLPLRSRDRRSLVARVGA